VELILVRHGQPAWTTEDGRGRNDPPLTNLGQAQAQQMATRLADPTIEPALGPCNRLFSSPAIRAQETAVPIAAALGLPIDTREWLWELRNPDDWEDRPIEEIQQVFEEVRTRTRDGWWAGIEGGELPADFHVRVVGGLRALLAELSIRPSETEPGLWDVGDDAPDRIVVVAHGGTNSTIVASLLGVEPEPWEWERFSMGHASAALLMTVPVAGAHLWSLRALGDATHLHVADRTR
jgi:probable phosphoglycerate mutase